jgi:adenylyltransferase/sulfurtransferase
MEDRYVRLSRFRPIGTQGLKQIQNKRAVIVGMGALGTVLAEQLVRSGIGEITIIDRDIIELSNLQRQTLYSEDDVRHQWPKAQAAKKRLQAINHDVKVTAVTTDINASNAEALLSGHDVILDGTDNFETRFIINDVAVKHGIPWIYGAATGSYGLVYTYIPEETPCLSCIYRYLPAGGETCETVGIIAPASHLTASLQCAEALKLLTDNRDAVRKGLFYFDIWTNDFSQIAMPYSPDRECPTCQHRQFPYLEVEFSTKTTVLCGRETVQIRPAKDTDFDYQSTVQRFQKAEFDVKSNDFLTQLVIPPYRVVLFKDGRALIHGTNHIDEAKRLYQNYIGG